MVDLHDLSAAEQAAAVRSRTVSPVELVEHYLDRIDEHDRSISSFVTVTADAARVAAREAEHVVTTEDPRELPALHGVPIAFKDLTMTAGTPTMFGSAALVDNVPPFDADVVALLRSAGTICLGKTAVSEFGILLSCETLIGPPTRNPWQPALIAGGSSGGAAAAVAAGLVPFAQGSDGGGSVRVPAALCGVVGMKPSRGVVSHGPLHSGMFGLPTNGPLGRTVTDVAMMLDVMAVPMPGEPHLPPPPPPEGSFTAALARDTRRAGGRPLRVARYAVPLLAETTVDPAALQAWEETSRLLDGLGCEVFDVQPSFDPVLGPLFDQVQGALAANPLSPERERQLAPLSRHVRQRASKLTAWALLGILGQVQNAVRLYMREMRDVDLVLTPTIARVSAPIGYFTEPDDPVEQLRRQRQFSPFCAMSNLTGQPAVSLPLGSTVDGLPVGVMLAAQPGADATLLAVAVRLEEASPWAHRHPPGW